MGRKVRVTGATPRTAWCRVEGTNASVSGGGGNGGGGGGCVGDRSRTNKCNIPSGSSDVAIDSNWTKSVEPTGALPEESMGLGVGGNISRRCGSLDESAATSGGRCSGGAREPNMYPMVGAPLFTEIMSSVMPQLRKFFGFRRQRRLQPRGAAGAATQSRVTGKHRGVGGGRDPNDNYGGSFPDPQSQG